MCTFCVHSKNKKTGSQKKHDYFPHLIDSSKKKQKRKQKQVYLVVIDLNVKPSYQNSFSSERQLDSSTSIMQQQ